MSELLERIAKENKDRILRLGKSIDELEVICPYCTEEKSDAWELDIQPNDEDHEAQCDKCHRHFMVSARLVYSTRRLK